MVVRKIWTAVCGAAVVGATLFAGLGEASAEDGRYPIIPYSPPTYVFNPYSSLNSNGPNGAAVKVETNAVIGCGGVDFPGGFQIIDLKNLPSAHINANGHGFEIIQQNGGLPVVLPY